MEEIRRERDGRAQGSVGIRRRPRGLGPIKAKEKELKENFERAAKRCRACEEETLEKKQRV